MGESSETGTFIAVEGSKAFEWMIDDFERQFWEQPGPHNRIHSPFVNVKLSDDSVSQWNLEVVRRVGRYELLLKCSRTEPPSIFRKGIRCRFDIEMVMDSGRPLWQSKVGSVLGSKTFTDNDPEHNSILAFDCSIRFSRRDFPLHQGRVRIRMILTVESDAERQNLRCAGFCRVPPHPVWEVLLKDTEFTDVTLRCRGSEEIKAHKSVLACSSVVLRKMFTTNMKEAASGVVEMDDLDVATLRVILQYIYTGKVDSFDRDIILPVIHGAEKYGLDELKDYGFSKLLEGITEENAAEVAVMAYLYRAQPEIVNAIREYSDRDFLERVRADEKFRKLVLQYPDAFLSNY